MLEITPLSRRHFLGLRETPRLSRFTNPLADPPEQEPFQPEGVPKSVEVAGELFAFVLLALGAYHNSQDVASFYSVQSESLARDVPRFKEMVAELGEFGKHFAQLHTETSELLTAWTNAYRKKDSDGDPYWREPSQLTATNLSSSTITQLEALAEKLSSRSVIALDQAPQSFDFRPDASNLYYTSHEEDQKLSRVTAGLSVVALAGAFALYEEVIAKASTAIFMENRPIIDPDHGVGRRTALKIIAAFLGSYIAYKAHQKFMLQNVVYLDTLQNHAQSVVQKINNPDEENFERYFSISLDDLYSQLNEYRDTLEAALNSGYDPHQGMLSLDGHWPTVQQHLSSTLATITTTLSYLEQTFAMGSGKPMIPPDFSAITKSLWATEQIQVKSQTMEGQVVNRHWINAAISAVGMGGLAVLTEAVIIPLTDALSQSSSR